MARLRDKMREDLQLRGLGPRYEDPAIERLAEIARGAKHDDATYAFTNVDMFADAKRFKNALKL